MSSVGPWWLHQPVTWDSHKLSFWLADFLQVHGRLFQIEALLKAEKLHRGPNSQIALQRNAFDLLLQGIQESPHPAIQAAYLDVCRLALQNPPQNRKLEDEIPLRQKSAASRTGQTQSNSEILDLTNQAIRNKAISGLRKVAKAILELPEQAGSVSGFSPPGLSEIRLNQLKSSPMLSKLVRSARACLDENLPEDADSAMTQLQKLALTKELETSSGKQSSSGADRPKLVDATRMRNPIDGSEGALESSENSSQQCGLISPLSLDGSDESKDEGSHMTKGSRPNLSPSEAERFLLATAEQVRPNHPVGVRLAAQRRLNNSGKFQPSTFDKSSSKARHCGHRQIAWGMTGLVWYLHHPKMVLHNTISSNAGQHLHRLSRTCCSIFARP